MMQNFSSKAICSNASTSIFATRCSSCLVVFVPYYYAQVGESKREEDGLFVHIAPHTHTKYRFYEQNCVRSRVCVFAARDGERYTTHVCSVFWERRVEGIREQEVPSSH